MFSVMFIKSGLVVNIKFPSSKSRIYQEKERKEKKVRLVQLPSILPSHKSHRHFAMASWLATKLIISPFGVCVAAFSAGIPARIVPHKL